MVFNLDQFQEKLITRFFKNKPKKNKQLFCPNFGKNGYPIYLPLRKKSEKTNQFLRQTPSWQTTNRQTVNGDFIRPSVGQYFNNQFGFDAGNSCVHQLLLLTHEIYKTFNANPSSEMSGVFLDLRKAFEIVWYKGPPKNRVAKKKKRS